MIRQACLLLAFASPFAAQTDDTLRFGDPASIYDRPFFENARYDTSIPDPSALLGDLHGSRLAHHAEILAAFEAWAQASPKLNVVRHGTTHEGRALVHAVITSEQNHARLESILADVAKLADPRGLGESDAERIVRDTPAVAWLGYSIHGDELSGADASLAVAYHLIASTDEAVAALLDRLVVVIDPCMNPDGRERIVGMVEQSAGYTPNFDYASMQRGRWPWGRGNHYLFDLNRDWMSGIHPETRARWSAALAYHPQLFVDGHEMGSLDTFLTYPQNAPVNPELPPKLIEWQRRYAEDAAAAFDHHGWSYYTREWADAWAPFYSDAWGSLIGAIGILYEQASTYGFPLRRESGELLSYREAVHHQVAASWANLGTLAEHREAALRDYLAIGRRNVDTATPGNERSFVVVPGTNPGREQAFLDMLLGQGIEVFAAQADFDAKNARDRFGQGFDERSFDAGAWIVPARQAARPRVRAFLDFDVRMPDADLLREREELIKKGVTRIYDVTSWSLAHALDLDSYWVDAPSVDVEPAAGSEAHTRVDGPAPAVAWCVSAGDDRGVAFAARAMESWLAVNVADEAFEILGVSGERIRLPRGSFIVRATENEGDAERVEQRVLRAATQAGVELVHRSPSGLAPGDGADLGGGHFELLSRPRVALLGNAPFEPTTHGHLWHHLDAVLGIPVTLLDAQSLGGQDLRRYNVLVVPPAYRGLGSILEPLEEDLAHWIEAGGTLIACGSSAAELTSGRLGLSAVSLRRDALDELMPFEVAARRDVEARAIAVDASAVWGDAPAEPQEDAEGEETESEEDDPYAPIEVPEEHDSWLRLFSPEGVTLRGLVDEQSWITASAGSEMPVFASGSYAYLSKAPTHTAVRLAGEPRLRLAGLVWPEARERLANSAWLTVERRGSGQIILFAAPPAFRGYHHATARLFANAVVLGPGLGADQPKGW